MEEEKLIDNILGLWLEELKGDGWESSINLDLAKLMVAKWKEKKSALTKKK